MKRLFGVAMFLGFTIFVPFLTAQADFTALKAPRFQLGAGALYLSPDYGPKADEGMSAWLDANLTPWLGAEAEAHLGTLISPTDIGENSYLLGPRLTHRDGRAQIYIKGLYGRGTYVFDEAGPRYISRNYWIVAGGGGIDYRLSHNFNWRLVDAEYQSWISFKPHGLTPYTISSGLMYIIH